MEGMHGEPACLPGQGTGWSAWLERQIGEGMDEAFIRANLHRVLSILVTAEADQKRRVLFSTEGGPAP